MALRTSRTSFDCACRDETARCFDRDQNGGLLRFCCFCFRVTVQLVPYLDEPDNQNCDERRQTKEPHRKYFLSLLRKASARVDLARRPELDAMRITPSSAG